MECTDWGLISENIGLTVLGIAFLVYLYLIFRPRRR